MCQIKSGIVLKDRVFCPLDYDSHEEMIKELGLDDKTTSPNFVRVEIVPKDGNIFNHKLNNWELQVDQDFKPDWFSKKFAEAEMKKELEKWWEERFIISGKIEKIDKGRWYLGGSAQVGSISGSAKVGNISDSAKVDYIYGSAQVDYIYGSAKVGSISGSAKVDYIYGSAQVGNLKGRAILCVFGEKVEYKKIEENGMAILYYKQNPEIVVANKNMKLINFEDKAK